MDFIKYSADGQAVCAAHHLTVCGYCCVDFTDLEVQQVVDDDSDDDQVFVLGTGINRFMPQWDEQILGPANTVMIKKNYDTPSKPDRLPASALVACSECELTWLSGKEGPTASTNHPSHHTLFHQYAGTRRSLVVHTDGACFDNGRPGARDGIGVYFGPRSKYNVSIPLNASMVPTNQVAELHALLHAMRVVRKHIVPARSVIVHGVSDTKHFRLILATDSGYAVESMCKHFAGWTADSRNKTLRNRQGKKIANSEILLALKAEVEDLSRVGVQVSYYHIPRELNQDADALAKAGAAACGKEQSIRSGNNTAV